MIAGTTMSLSESFQRLGLGTTRKDFLVIRIERRKPNY
jgi:hypothetical protein